MFINFFFFLKFNYKSAALSDYNVQGVIELHLDLSYLFM